MKKKMIKTDFTINGRHFIITQDDKPETIRCVDCEGSGFRPLPEGEKSVVPVACESCSGEGAFPVDMITVEIINKESIRTFKLSRNEAASFAAHMRDVLNKGHYKSGADYAGPGKKKYDPFPIEGDDEKPKTKRKKADILEEIFARDEGMMDEAILSKESEEECAEEDWDEDYEEDYKKMKKAEESKKYKVPAPKVKKISPYYDKYENEEEEDDERTPHEKWVDTARFLIESLKENDYEGLESWNKEMKEIMSRSYNATAEDWKELGTTKSELNHLMRKYIEDKIFKATEK